MATFTRHETVALALLTTLGATALDAGVAEAKRRQFADTFGFEVTEAVVVAVIDKLAAALSGSEQIIINE